MSSRLASEGSVGQDDITRANSTIAVLLKTNRYEWMTNPNLYDAACARPNTPAAGSNVHNAMSVDKGANDSASTIIKRSPDRPSQINNSVSPTGLPLPDGSSVTGSSPPTSASQTPSNKTPQPPGARNNKGTARPQLKSRTNSKGKSISSVDINPCQFQSLNSPSTPSASTNPKSPGANTITPPKKRTSKQPSAKYVCPPAEDPRWNM
jgi:hypothetical protein